MPLRILLLLSFLLTALPVYAFDPSGTRATAYLLLGLGGFTALNLLAQLTFFAAGFYQQTGFAKKHLLLSLLPVALGTVLTLWDTRGGAELVMNGGLLLVSLAFALLPWLLIEKSVTPRPLIAALLPVLFLAMGCFIGPITAFALITAHAARPKQTPVGKYLCVLVLCLGYPLLGYYLYQLAGKL
ncbi:hypothetical protein SHAM105786_03435 [Shewanella amazonensis]|uniref:Uncharacterized protein n=1 Tax=Shewanella amazonensis (strain ATCC BAA-1098 / SB2B) TaxID=326297 RepID=A1S4V5_SHEAM|nr:hypothetical protein [Shewanella amazonensis]ABL99411.1 hypothetical protein Sama_1204 [Shewanella amazonensis SB2B]